MNISSALNMSTRQTVHATIAANPLGIIIGQPITQSMNLMTEQTAEITAAIRTTAYGGKHGCLALVLGATDYCVVMGNSLSSTNLLEKWKGTVASLTTQATPFNILTAKERSQADKKEYKIQEAVNKIGVELIIKCIEPQCTKEKDEEYSGYSNKMIKSLLLNAQSTWCKLLTKEKTDAGTAFYQPWLPDIHIITFGHQLNKNRKLCNKRIGIPSATPTLYSSSSKRWMHGEISTNERWWNTRWRPTKLGTKASIFSELSKRKKAYREDRAGHSGFERAVNIMNRGSNIMGHSTGLSGRLIQVTPPLQAVSAPWSVAAHLEANCYGWIWIWVHTYSYLPIYLPSNRSHDFSHPKLDNQFQLNSQQSTHHHEGTVPRRWHVQRLYKEENLQICPFTKVLNRHSVKSVLARALKTHHFHYTYVGIVQKNILPPHIDHPT